MIGMTVRHGDRGDSKTLASRRQSALDVPFHRRSGIVTSACPPQSTNTSSSVKVIADGLARGRARRGSPVISSDAGVRTLSSSAAFGTIV